MVQATLHLLLPEATDPQLYHRTTCLLLNQLPAPVELATPLLNNHRATAAMADMEDMAEVDKVNRVEEGIRGNPPNFI